VSFVLKQNGLELGFGRGGDGFESIVCATRIGAFEDNTGRRFKER
jgi:hypothetical protein